MMGPHETYSEAHCCNFAQCGGMRTPGPPLITVVPEIVYFESSIPTVSLSEFKSFLKIRNILHLNARNFLSVHSYIHKQHSIVL